jgi:hypothetical protein
MRKILLIIGIVFIMVFSGCSSGTDAKQNGYVGGDTFVGGSDALRAEFGENQPPEKIRDGGIGSFNVRVLIQNIGEHSIEEGQGYISLFGINYEDFGYTREQASQALPALRGFRKQGDSVIDGQSQPVTFSGLKYVPTLPGNSQQKLSLDICYPYQTKALVSACISGNTLQSFDDDLKVCALEGPKDFVNSGAPVQISNAKQNSAGKSSIQIQFDIEHVGTEGRIYREGDLDNECKVLGNPISSIEASNSADYVTYTVSAGNLANIDCGGTGTNTESVLLNGDKYTVYCVIDTTGEEDYEKPLDITLDYDYFERISTDVEIEHVGE